MSLINQMLKDLDARQPRPADAQAGALRGMGLVEGDGSSAASRRWMVPVVAALALLPAALLLRQPDSPTQAPARPDAPAAIAPTLPQPVPAATPARSTGKAEPEATPSQPATRTTPDASDADTPVAPRETQVKPATTHTPVVDKAAAPTVRLSPRQRARLALRRAIARVEAGDDARAEPLLREALSLDHRLADARVQLASLLLRARRLVDAELALIEGLSQHHGHPALSELYARLLVERGDNARALQLLNEAGAGRSRDPELRALRAAILMKTGDPRGAADDYRQALAGQPERAVWWMGLGVALEQSGDSRAARAAYRRAGALPLEPALQEFVAGRIAALGDTANNRE